MGRKKTVASDELVCLDLFSGLGGISLGMEWAGIRPALGVDIVPAAAETYRANFESIGADGIVADLESDGQFNAIVARARASGVNVVVGGPPCQGFSQVGNHRDLQNDKRNNLYKRFVRAIDELQPLAFIMENVPGLEQRNGGSVLEVIFASLRLGDRYVVQAETLDAADFGVPQSRKRLFFVGLRADVVGSRKQIARFLPTPAFSLQSDVQLERIQDGSGTCRYALKDHTDSRRSTGRFFGESTLKALLDPADRRLVTVRQALGDLEHFAPGERLKQTVGDEVGRYAGKACSAYQAFMRSDWRSKGAGLDLERLTNAQVPFMWDDTRRRLAVVPPGGNYRDIPPELQKRYLNGQKWGPETGREELSRKYFFAYRRLFPDYVSWTLNTKGDCVYHYNGERALSVREFARLTSIPDRFVVLGTDKHTRYRLVGNAVPPLLARAVGERVAALLRAAVAPPKATVRAKSVNKKRRTSAASCA